MVDEQLKHEQLDKVEFGDNGGEKLHWLSGSRVNNAKGACGPKLNPSNARDVDMWTSTIELWDDNLSVMRIYSFV